MNTLDIIFIIIMVASLVISSFRGGVRELFSLGAVVLGFVAASNLYFLISNQMLRITSHEDVNNIISFLLIFVFVAALISYIGGQFSHIVKKSHLGLLNLMAGTAVGTIKGLFVCALLTYALLVFMKPGGGFFSGSKAFPFMSHITTAVSPIGPKHFREELDKKLDALLDGSAPEAVKADKPKPSAKPGK